MKLYFDPNTNEILLRNYYPKTGPRDQGSYTRYDLGQLLLDYLDLDFEEIICNANHAFSHVVPKNINEVNEKVLSIKNFFRYLESKHPYFFAINEHQGGITGHYLKYYIQDSMYHIEFVRRRLEKREFYEKLFKVKYPEGLPESFFEETSSAQYLEIYLNEIIKQIYDYKKYFSDIQEIFDYCFGEFKTGELLQPINRFVEYCNVKHFSIPRIILSFEVGRFIRKTEEQANVYFSSEGVVKEQTVYEVYKGNVNGLLYFELLKLLSSGYRVSKCKNCNRYFINKGRSDAIYCGRITDGKSCKEVGASNKYKNKIKNDPIMKLYDRAYKRHYAKVLNGKMSKSKFYSWSENARQMRENAKTGLISFNEYKNWIEQ